MLTAAHVVCEGNRPVATVQVRAASGDLAEATVVWHQLEGRLDVALLEVSGREWVPVRRRHPVRWGRLVTSQPRQRYQAVGFPEVQASPQLRDSEQATGTINPQSMYKAGLYALAVDDPPPRVQESPSPWAGMSGAAVFCQGLLSAIVVEDPAGFDSHRLVALPVAAFAGDAEFQRRVEGCTGSAVVCRPIELAPLSTSVPGVDSPAGLLRADVAPMPFRPRLELSVLVDWCEQDELWSAQLVIGPGGQGKTRLARQLVDQLPQQEWTSVILTDTTAPGELDVLATVTCPLLVVVDYAETRTVQLAELVPHLQSGEQKTRLLLIARTADSWREQSATLSPHLEFLPRVTVRELSPLEPDPEGRQEAWREAVHALADVLPTIEGYDRVNWATSAGELSPPPLRDDGRYRTILAVLIDALAALLRQDPSVKEGHDRSAADVLLAHEGRYWARAAAARQVAQNSSVQRRAVAVATLWGAVEENEALAVLKATPGLRDLREHELLELAEWLGSLYRESGRYWSRLQPDRLAEHLLSTVIEPRMTFSLAQAGAAVASAPQLSNARMLLAQTTVQHPDLMRASAELARIEQERWPLPETELAVQAKPRAQEAELASQRPPAARTAAGPRTLGADDGEPATSSERKRGELLRPDADWPTSTVSTPWTSTLPAESSRRSLQHVGAGMPEQPLWAHQAFDQMLELLEVGKISRECIADVATRLLIAAPTRPSQSDIAQGLPRITRTLSLPKLPALLPESVSRAVTALLSMQLITQHKARADRPGRPYTPLQLGHQRWAMVGVTIGHRLGRVTEFGVLVTGLDGIPLELANYQGDGETYIRPLEEGDDVMVSLASVIEEICDLPPVRQRYILGVGIEVAGHVFDGEVVDASLNSMYGVNLGRELSRRLASLAERLNRITKDAQPLPVVVDNDLNVLAVLETYDPRSPEQNLAVIAVFDDGIGSALIINGQVYRGGGGMAGEIGHLLVPIDTSNIGQGGIGEDHHVHQAHVGLAEPPRGDRLRRFSDVCYCGRSSHVDCYATPERIRGELGGRDFDELAAAPATSGTSPTQEGLVFQLAGQALGIAIASLVNLNNPSRVLLFLPPALAQAVPGSAAEQYLRQIKEMLTEHAFSNAKKTPIDYEQLSADARRYFGAKAAAVRVIDSLVQHAKRQCTCYIPKPQAEPGSGSDHDVIDDLVATLHDHRVRL